MDISFCLAVKRKKVEERFCSQVSFESLGMYYERTTDAYCILIPSTIAIEQQLLHRGPIRVQKRRSWNNFFKHLKLFYTSSCFLLCLWYTFQINCLIFNFLFKSKKEKEEEGRSPESGSNSFHEREKRRNRNAQTSYENVPQDDVRDCYSNYWSQWQSFSGNIGSCFWLIQILMMNTDG